MHSSGLISASNFIKAFVVGEADLGYSKVTQTTYITVAWDLFNLQSLHPQVFCAFGSLCLQI